MLTKDQHRSNASQGHRWSIIEQTYDWPNILIDDANKKIILKINIAAMQAKTLTQDWPKILLDDATYRQCRPKIVEFNSSGRREGGSAERSSKSLSLWESNPQPPVIHFKGWLGTASYSPSTLVLRHTNTSSSPRTGKLFTMTKEQWGQVVSCSSQLSMHLWHPAMWPQPWWGLTPLLCTPHTWMPVSCFSWSLPAPVVDTPLAISFSFWWMSGVL